MSKLVGKFKILLILTGVLLVGRAHAIPSVNAPKELGLGIKWSDFERISLERQRQDYLNGISYIASGSIALIGGFVGQSITQDPLEKGVYTLFQTIGIASIGYGAYTWKLGGDDRVMYASLKNSRGLTEEQRTNILYSFQMQKRDRDRTEKIIKAVTHSLIAGFNIYNASQQKQENIRNGLYFIGGVNLLAAISFTFQ